MWNYRRRVERDLTRWREAGWVSPAGEAAIRQDLASGVRALGLANSLAILSAVLIGFAVMSFVAANWEDMPRILRLALLFAALWGSYGLAFAFSRRGMEGFGHAAILAGIAIFGANIMMISQMYHMDGNVADFIFVWGAVAAFTGMLLQSNPALAFAMVLAVVWGCIQSANRGLEVYWPFLAPWAVISIAFFTQRWRPGLHLSGLALSGFLISLGYMLGKGHAHGLVVALGLLTMGVSVAGTLTKPDLSGLWSGVLNYGILITGAGLFALQFIEDPSLDMFMLLAVLALILALAAIFWGLYSHNGAAVWLGYIGFSFEVMSVYVKTMGTLLNTSLFFLVAGLIFSGLAALAYRIHARTLPPRDGTPALEART